MNAKHKRIVASLALIHIKILPLPVDNTRATILGDTVVQPFPGCINFHLLSVYSLPVPGHGRNRLLDRAKVTEERQA